MLALLNVRYSLISTGSGMSESGLGPCGAYSMIIADFDIQQCHTGRDSDILFVLHQNPQGVSILAILVSAGA